MDLIVSLLMVLLFGVCFMYFSF